MNTATTHPSLQDHSGRNTPAVSVMLITAASFSVAAVTLWLAFFDSAALF